MKYLYSLVLSVVVAITCVVPTTQASEVSPEIRSQVEKVSTLYGDGKASLRVKTIQVKDVVDEETGYCVTLVSFYMSGFSGGNNSSQFITFLKCKNENGDYAPNVKFEKSIIGVHPFYHHRNKYDLESATYIGRIITINSPKGGVNFTNKYSIWWSQSEQIDI